MSNMDDFECVKELLEKFKSYFSYGVVKEIKIEDPISLNDIWAKKWEFPCAKNVGVYLIFNKEGKLLYVGKASASSSIGIRLASYFKNDPADPHKWVKTSSDWDGEPYSIAAIAVEKMNQSKNGQGWLAPALEEFLITHLSPPDNTQLKG